MEKSKIISLMSSAFEDSSCFDSLVKVSEATRLISNSLVLSATNPLALDCDIIKTLIYAIPINANNNLFLLKTIFTKFQHSQQLIENCWRVLEFIADIEDDETSLSLNMKFLELGVDSVKKTNKITLLEEEYLLERIVELKTYILQLLPDLLTLTHQNFPETMKDKMIILRVLKTNSRDEQVVASARKLYDQAAIDYNLEMDCKSDRFPLINKTKKNPLKKLQHQSKVSVEKSILEEAVASGTSQIFSLLGSETRLETFLTYIICPNAIPVDKKIWQKFGSQQKSAERIRKDVSVNLLCSKESLTQILNNAPDLLTMFFNLVQRYFRQTSLTTIITILHHLWEAKPIPVTILVMQTKFLQKVFYNLEDSSVYNLIYNFTTLNHQWVHSHMELFYDYFELAGFFRLILVNMTQKKSVYLNPLKAKDYSDLEMRLQSKAAESLTIIQDQELLDIDVPHLPIRNTPYLYASPSIQFSMENCPFPQTRPKPNNSSIGPRKKTSQRVSSFRDFEILLKPKPNISLPPFAVKQYRGYCSTSPIISFSKLDVKPLESSIERWCYTNCRLYYQILHSLINDKEDRFELIKMILPSEEYLQILFQKLKLYRSIPLNTNNSNSSIEISKILLLLLRHPKIDSHYHNLPLLCSRSIPSIYPIINAFFQNPKPQTYIQKLKVFKTLDPRIMQIVELLLLMVRNLPTLKKAQILSDIDESLWQILTLWFLDCMLNNIYQTIVYKLLVEVFTHGSEILLLNILFKNNLVGTLYNAYSDVMKNGVLITEWHIHSFFFFIHQIHSLIKTTSLKRSNLGQISNGLAKMLSWNLLEEKILSNAGSSFTSTHPLLNY